MRSRASSALVAAVLGINVQRYPPALAGAALLPLSAIVFVFSRFSDGLAARIGARGPLVLGALLAALAAPIACDRSFQRRPASR